MGAIDIKRINSIINKHSPEVLTAIGIVGTVARSILYAKQNPIVWWNMYLVTGLEDYRVKYYMATKSNNWLKIHGYPMRRKLRKRRH